jgi:glycogen operon protein
LGATWGPESTNFAVFAPEATAVELCLFGPGPDGVETETRHTLTEMTLGIWHGAVPDLPVGQLYGFRADGPWEPARGRLFNPAKLLLDPYARAVSGSVAADGPIYGYRPPASQDADAVRAAQRGPRCDIDSAPYVPRSVVVHDDFDWGDDEQVRPRTRWTDTVVYELHVKGFTQLHGEVPEDIRGTYAGLTTPAAVNYLKDLGVTTVELLPVHQSASEPHVAQVGLTNYWGYNSLGFFAPHGAYASTGDRGTQVTEFKAMVKALHRAGLEVILDVVYNHTAEGSPLGPTLSFRGLDDIGYYKHVDWVNDGATYFDVTGCGNTVDVAYPPMLRLVLDSLRYWVTEMHVDGFRFDLTPALTRSGHRVDLGGHFISAVNQDPVLRHVKLIAEPWDLGPHGWRTGQFPPPFAEWNDRFRDAARTYWLRDLAVSTAGDTGHGVRDLATRLAGSQDLFGAGDRGTIASVNFVTAHDGFTLADLTRYDHKHNEANGHGGTDGSNDNRSWNHGVEGPTDDPEIRAARRRSMRNLLATLLLSAGVPMLNAGDEFGRSHGGNNNPYSQDNQTSWCDWELEPWQEDLLATTRHLIALRAKHPVLRQRAFFTGRAREEGGLPDLSWYGGDGIPMGSRWDDPTVDVVQALFDGGPLGHDSLLLVLNGDALAAEVTLPHIPGSAAYDLLWDSASERPDGPLLPVPAGEEAPMTGASLRLWRAIG